MSSRYSCRDSTESASLRREHQRHPAVAFGILGAIVGAAALTALAVWLIDQTPNGSWQELVLAIALDAVSAACALAHHWARSAMRRWPHAERTGAAH